jgi:predicted nucleic acid-binding protein
VTNYVADTHALYFHLTRSSELGPAAAAAFDEADRGSARVHVPAIVLAELFFMNVKLKRVLDYARAYTHLNTVGQFVLLADEPGATLDFERNAAAKEMHDRMIVGTAARLGAPLITRDDAIIKSGLVPTIWF